MKQVTIDTVRERIAELEKAERISMISLRAEFELACLRMLVVSMDVKPFMYGIADPDGAAHMDECCVSTSMAGIEDYVHMLNEECEEGGPLFTVVALYTAPPAQVTSVDDDVRNVVALLENNEWAEHCTKTELGQRLESEITRLVGHVQPATECSHTFEARPVDGSNSANSPCEAVCKICGAKPEPITDNTAQQFEALATSAGSGKL